MNIFRIKLKFMTYYLKLANVIVFIDFDEIDI